MPLPSCLMPTAGIGDQRPVRPAPTFVLNVTIIFFSRWVVMAGSLLCRIACLLSTDCFEIECASCTLVNKH